MIPAEIKATIDDALEIMISDSIAHGDEGAHQTYHDARAWLQQDAPQPLDFPDGAGWWAFEGRAEVGTAYFYDKTIKTICRVSRMGAEYVADGNRVTYMVKYMHGKWYRLTMPWEGDTQPTSEA